MKHARTAALREQGLAMVAVLLVLMALFVLSAPFLVTVRNADQASAESSDRSVLRVTLDSAGRHAAAELAGSHSALDATPYFDDLEELRVSSRFPEDFLATADPEQVMWDLAAEDVAARIDLASASPHVFANLIGGAARLSAQCRDKDTAIEVSDAEGFLPEGVVLVDDELMGYAELGPTKLGRLTRGLLVKLDQAGNPAECGPRPAGAHEVGAFVLDQRAWALCEWRIAPNLPGGKLRLYEGIEELREARDFMLVPELGREAYLALERTTSTFGYVRAGARWQHAARVVGDPSGEPQYGCKLAVDELRWFNPGTTVWITDGTNSEYALVRSTERSGVEGGKLVLFESLHAPFKAFDTIVAPLARTPVNVNTATPEVLRALWTNLKLRGKSARITAGEADKLVEVALVSRPFTGFEDFLRRLVLPAAGLEELPKDAPVRPEALEELGREAKLDANGLEQLAGFIDPDDARALYKNALNANDNELEFATMPLAFTSRDVYRLDLRASVNAPSGVERARGVRELTELIVPQRDLMQLWTRQEDFDEAPRLGLAAAGWMSGPVPTSRHDPLYGDVASMRWPTRARAHLGAHDSAPSVDPLAEDTVPVHCFAERDTEDGWAQLAPYREQDGARDASYALHFDDESKELEGRYLPDGAATLDLAKLGWSGSGSLMQAMAASLWIKPRELEEGALLLDVAGQYSDADRVSLLFEGGNLVLRALDGAGDHPTSTFKERAEILFPLSGEGPGIPRDTWTHVQVAVDGTRPDQMALWVDGRRSDRTPGLTRLTAALGDQSNTIAVESTEGFPEKCVLRIGQELIEAFKKGPKSFEARFQPTGVDAGFGGRIAREIHSGYPEQNAGLSKPISHPVGSSVQLYGYSAPVFSNVPNVEAALTDELGMFHVALVTGIVKQGSEKMGAQMEPIVRQSPQFAFSYNIGHGLDTQGDDIDGLLLAPVDPSVDISEVMKTFSPSGGYAAILAVRFGQGTDYTDIDGARVGGVEVIRYSGWEGATLEIDQRGDEIGLRELQGQGISPDVQGIASFVVSYGTGDVIYDPPGDETLSLRVMVIPISLPMRNTGSVTSFDPANNGSAFVQITHGGGESHLTEWARYDEISPEGFLVRDDPNSLVEANRAAHPGWTSGITITEPTRPPAILAPGAASAGLAFEPVRGGRAALPARVARAAVSAPAPQKGGVFWDYLMGVPDDKDFPVARAVNSVLQFRGVLGTFTHAHPAGTQVLPVFELREAGETAGWPGRFDHVMFLSSEPSEPGFPALIHHAHRPYEYLAYAWDDGGPLTPVAVDPPATASQSGFDTFNTHVALDDRLEVPFAPTAMFDADANPIDSRLLNRMALFPSGELPREVQTGQFGGDAFAGSGKKSGGAIPSATVDEALFFPSFAAEVSGMPTQLIVASGFDENDESFTVLKDTIRTPLGDWVLDDPTIGDGATASKPGKKVKGANLKIDVLKYLPPRGGLLRIGDELLCYDSYDRAGTAFTFTVPPSGRGLLGTEPQTHRPTESISYIGSLPLGVLATNVGADDAELTLIDEPKRFPSHGLVLIEDELVHFSRLDGPILAMPSASVEPGAMDGKGPGLFRGRFGTQRSSHTSGTPAILFPFRYWDRWSELADAPELTFYELACDQPDAFWRRVFWKTEEAAHPGPQLGVLQRTNADTPWDAPPEDTNGLQFLWQGKLDADGNPIGVQSDRVEWRVFVRYQPGSFDPSAGLAHGWKTTPRLSIFGVEFMGPGRTLARVDR